MNGDTFSVLLRISLSELSTENKTKFKSALEILGRHNVPVPDIQTILSLLVEVVGDELQSRLERMIEELP